MLLSDFAIRGESIKSGHLSGHKLSLCGQEYVAWEYDTYIYDAIELAKKWNPGEVNYKRLIHLRDWLRENVQHGHNIPTQGVNTLALAKNFIDQVIKAEYLYAEGESKNFEQRELKTNRKLFSDSHLKQKI